MKEQNYDNSMADDAHLKNDTAGQAEIEKAMAAIENMKAKDVKAEKREQPDLYDDEEGDRPSEIEEEEEPETPEAPEEEVESEPEPGEEKPEPIKEKKKGKKPWDPRKEQFVLHAALEKKEQENAYLRSLLDQSKSISSDTYGALIEKEIADAKYAVKKAIADGDADALADAQFELNKVAYKQQDFYKTKAEQDYQNQIANQQYIQPEEPVKLDKAKKAIADDWSDYINETYPTLVKGSRHYDPNLYNDVSNMVEQYNWDLVNQGYGDAIYSVEYFQKINEGIESLNRERRQTAKPKTSLPPAPIAAVRNSYANSTHGVTTSRPKEKPQLRGDALSIIDNFNAPWMNSKELRKHWEKNL